MDKLERVPSTRMNAPQPAIRLAPWPFFTQDEIDAVNRVLRSGKVNYWTGEEGVSFEKEFAQFHGVKHAIALANGSVALELALHALGIGPGDEVVVTPRSYIASASCIVLVGAKPVFADVDRTSQNITAETIEKVITPRTKAIVAVHLAGWPCDMPAIMDLAKKHNLKVIEDCAQAHGAKLKGKYVGTFGHAAAFSFCQDKIITTGGEGGMLLTNDDSVWSFAWSYKDHGKNYERAHRAHHPLGYRWLHDRFGTNWRMTEMQAAIGRVQLRKMSYWVDLRRRNASILHDRFSNIEAFRLTPPPEDVFHSYYKYYAFLRPEKLNPGWDRQRIMSRIHEEGLPSFNGGCSEIYLEKAFSESTLKQGHRLLIAQELGETSLMFMVHPTLSPDDMHGMAGIVEKVLFDATKQ